MIPQAVTPPQPWARWTGAPNKDVIRAHFDALAPSYDGLYTDARSLAEDDLTRDRLEAWLQSQRGPRNVLDIGCGTGFYVGLMLPSRWEYTGIDPSGRMIAHARRQYPVHDFRNVSVKELHMRPFTASVALNGTLGHDPCLPCTLRQIRRLTAPRGGLYAMFYGQGSVDRSPMDERHIPRWTVADLPALLDLFRRCGWQVTDTFGFGNWLRELSPGMLPRAGWRRVFEMEARMSNAVNGYHVVITATRMEDED